nr:class I SAM-dependent methyltransferase [Ornithinimicrobium sediminis]
MEGRHWWYRERRALLARAVADLEVGTSLDIGAAGGGNTLVLSGLGWSALALEHSGPGAVVASSRGLPVVRGDAHRLPFADRSLDLVTALDVLEHLQDDHAAARELHRVLRPGGRLVVTVPVDPRLWSAHDEAVGHVRRYTRPEILHLLTAAGLEVESVRSWMVLLRPAVALRRRRSTGSDLSRPPAWANAVLGAVVRMERHLPVGHLPGVSLLVRARRLPGAPPG